MDDEVLEADEEGELEVVASRNVWVIEGEEKEEEEGMGVG